MLAQGRRGPTRPAGGFGQFEGRSQGSEATELVVFEFDDIAPFLEVRVLGGFGHGENRGDGAARCLAAVHDFHLPVFGTPLVDHGIDEIGVFAPGEHVLKHFELHPLGVAHDLAQTIPLATFQGQHPHVAVLAGHDAGGCGEGHSDTGSLVESAVLGEAADVLATHECGRDGFGARNVDLLASAHILPAQSGSQSPCRRAHGAKEVRREGAVLQGHFPGSTAVAVAGPGEVVGVEVVALPVRVGARLTEGRNGNHHQLGIEGFEPFPIEFVFAFPSGGHVFDQDVRRTDQIAESVSPLGCFEVQLHGSFVGVEKMEEAAFFQMGDIPRKRTPGARGIPGIAELDLDDVGSKVRKKFGAIRC